MNQAYLELKAYCEDLQKRYVGKQEWEQRHPDHLSDEFEADEERYINMRLDGEDTSGFTAVSTFDPTDRCPSTADIVSAKMMLNMMQLITATWERTQ